MQAKRYSTAIVLIHWLTLLLMVAVYCTMEFRGIFERGSAERDLIKLAHYWLGLSLLWLTVIRLMLRQLESAPAIIPTPAQWQQRLAQFAHLLLYVFLMGMPILGWLVLSAEGKTISWLGLTLPAIWTLDKAFAHQLEDLHKALAYGGYYLIGLHALAALVHHYWYKDNTLVRMSLKD